MIDNLEPEKVKIPKESWKIVYLASMIDGEGTINLYKHPDAFKKMRPHFFVTNNSIELMEWFNKNFGGKIKKHGNSWRWGVWSVRDILKLTNSILPYLIIKKENAIKVREYCIKNLNARVL